MYINVKRIDEYKKLYNSFNKMLLSRESYMKSHYINIYNEILLFSNSLVDIKFGIRSYYYLMQNININICVLDGCVNNTKFISLSKGFHDCCSNSCSAKNSLHTRKKTMLRKHGVEFALQSNLFRDKFKNTCIGKFGFDNPAKCMSVKMKTSKTCLSRYGYTSVLGVPYIKNKIKETNIVKYNNYTYFGSVTSNTRIKEVMNYKYGVNYVHEIKRTEEEKLLIKYKKRDIIDVKWMNYMSKSYNIIEYWGYPKTIKIKCDKGHNYIITNNMLHQRAQHKVCICTVCNPINNTYSYSETEVCEYIKSLYTGKIIRNDRDILCGMELDIYLPDLNLAFEYNGLYWHSTKYKDKNYHKLKTDLCCDKGIKLLHIFEDMWLDKNDIIKSIIYSLFSNKINIDDYSIKPVLNIKMLSNFLNTCSINGYIECDINIGLFGIDGQLISLMGFNELSIGDYELCYYINELYSKYSLESTALLLFNYFVSISDNLNSIISYCDRSIADSVVLEKFNMSFVSHGEPVQYHCGKELDSFKIYNSGSSLYKILFHII